MTVPGTDPSESTYRRLGEVTATLLLADRTWTTGESDVLQSKAGDWWVVGPDGAGRGVAADRFDALYEFVDGDRYRRRGTVRARQATTTERIRTREGDAVAYPGMWIVRDGPDRWPVPDDEFRQGYEAVGDQS